MRNGPGLGTWVLLIVLGVGSLAAGFGVGLWWQDRDVSPKTARWVLTHSAQSAQLTPASAGLFTLTMSPADAQVIAVRQDDPGSSELIPARRLENEWQTMFGEESITVTLLVHDATTDADPDAASAATITLLAAAPVVDGDMVTYPVEVLEPTFIAQDGALRAFTEVTLVLPEAKWSVAGTSADTL